MPTGLNCTGNLRIFLLLFNSATNAQHSPYQTCRIIKDEYIVNDQESYGQPEVI